LSVWSEAKLIAESRGPRRLLGQLHDARTEFLEQPLSSDASDPLLLCNTFGGVARLLCGLELLDRLVSFPDRPLGVRLSSQQPSEFGALCSSLRARLSELFVPLRARSITCLF
jgi:hypothetical protein